MAEASGNILYGLGHPAGEDDHDQAHTRPFAVTGRDALLAHCIIVVGEEPGLHLHELALPVSWLSAYAPLYYHKSDLAYEALLRGDADQADTETMEALVRLREKRGALIGPDDRPPQTCPTVREIGYLPGAWT